MAEIEIGLGKSARQAYGLDEITIVPSRRTRDSRDVDISWEIDAYKFELPMLASSMDSAVSPAAAIELGRLGACGVLNLEGLWTRHEDPESALDELAKLPEDKAALRLHELSAEPIKEALVAERIREIKHSGVITAASLSPGMVQKYAKTIGQAELDLFVIQGSVVSAEHVSKTNDAFNMKQFIREFSLPVIVGGCASYQAALHLMRTGAAGILVGVGSGVAGVGVPQATAVADARGARMRHLDETGVYCHVISGGYLDSAADIAKSIVCGADAIVVGPSLLSTDKGERSLADITDQTFGALRVAMATTGYESLKDFQKAEIVVNQKHGANS